MGFYKGYCYYDRRSYTVKMETIFKVSNRKKNKVLEILGVKNRPLKKVIKEVKVVAV